jgi:hypothetical protein
LRLTSLIPKPAGSVEAAIAALRTEANNLNNMPGTSADERLGSYHAWAAQAGDQLGSVFDLQQVAWLMRRNGTTSSWRARRVTMKFS